MSCFPEYAEARVVMERLLKEKGCFFDGIFATNDMMALACVNVLTENQIKVPGQVKVVGFDNISLTQFTSPQITTIAQDTKELALHAADTILKMIEDEEQEKELEKLTDHQRVVLCDIQEEADVLDELLDAPRLDRKKLKKAASSIWLM